MKEKLQELQALMVDGGLTESVKVIETCLEAAAKKSSETNRQVQPRQIPNKGRAEVNVNQNHKAARVPNKITDLDSSSEETIYRNAVKKCNSNTSDEIDTSDKLLQMSFHDVSIAEPEPQLGTSGTPYRRSSLPPPMPRGRVNEYAFQPQIDPGKEADMKEQLDPEQHAQQTIRDAEAAKVKVFPPKGMSTDSKFKFIVQMDQDYLIVGAHVDEATQEKTIQGLYVDFSKLIPNDKMLTDEDSKLELVIRNGKTFWTPVSESVTINNFARWEQVFRVFSNIYTHHYPHKSGELIQYNHVIHSISLIYVWENIYSYDKEFRMHISQHPERSWAVILQQAWAMKLHDCIYRSDSQGNAASFTPNNYKSGNSNAKGTGNKYNDHCKRYNRGKCNLSSACAYDHKCLYCNKFGHGILVCRKLIFDKEKGTKHAGNNQGQNKNVPHSNNN